MKNLNRKISVIGLGYVGLPVAVAFGFKQSVVAYDINVSRVTELMRDHDATDEVSSHDLQQADMQLTSNIDDLKSADFHIVAVPTPIDDANQPDLRPLLSASSSLGQVLKPGDIVVYESTVYPGATEHECVPVLERESGLKCGVDFFVGYSPERINPGDKDHTFTKIKKVVSAQNSEVLSIVSSVYASVVDAGVFEAASIKVAEAAKVIENTQRDINIAFINELSKIFRLMDINIYEVLEAAETKWNFLPFKPGLVGGHCIGVDPYYLTYQAQRLGYHPDMILSGRRINDDMGRHIASLTVKSMIQHHLNISQARVAVCGFTFKENCPDIRNTKVIEIIDELRSYQINPIVIDDMADQREAKRIYGIDLQPLDCINECDVVIVAVAHESFQSSSMLEQLKQKVLVVDVKNILNLDNKITL